MDILKILERNTGLFKDDVDHYDSKLTEEIKRSRFLVLGGGGSIGQAVCKEIFKRGAECLHVVDLNENYLVELVRDLRSQFGYSTLEFDTYALDVGSDSFGKFIQIGKYDYVLNLSAMKHVRSENSAFSMKRMIKTNLINVLNTFDACAVSGVKKYFCVSTDKATNPANFMGATKRAMELALMRDGIPVPVSGARFANVAFSNGSLLEGFKTRVEKMQPLSLPIDIERFFITQQEAGIICLFSAILGSENQIFFPYNEEEVKLTSFKTVAENYLKSIGKQMIKCYNENDAREFIKSGDLECYWPVNLFETDTAGEKAFEEFYSSDEEIEYGEFKDLATIKLKSQKTKLDVDNFLAEITAVDVTSNDARKIYINIFKEFVDTFEHINSEKFLNSRM